MDDNFEADLKGEGYVESCARCEDEKNACDRAVQRLREAFGTREEFAAQRALNYAVDSMLGHCRSHTERH